MRAYGVKRRDFGCCPGHDKFPPDTYNSRRSKRARARDIKIAHGIARARTRAALRQSDDPSCLPKEAPGQTMDD